MAGRFRWSEEHHAFRRDDLQGPGLVNWWLPEIRAMGDLIVPGNCTPDYYEMWQREYAKLPRREEK